jgi:plasmid stabilization system protein ParE
MEIVVVWSDTAMEELRSIYDYLYFHASRTVADKISNDIVDRTLLLEQIPRAGQKEEMLAHLNYEIRYLVEGNYKIVYWIDENLVSIATVFDCRQNPLKLKSKIV